MFEFLKDKIYVNCDKNFEGVITGFDEKSNKLIIKGEDDSEQKTIETDIFDNQFTQDINEYDKWQDKLYQVLKNDKFVNVTILSIDSEDNWNIEIYKNETLLKETGDKIILITYTIVFADEIKETLSFQKKSKKHDKDKFIKWINEQIDNVEQFNVKGWGDYMEAITISDAFNSEEEIDLIWDMFWDMNIEKIVK